uniref:Uncharacterized protein n=1 Tax=Oryza glumipatula TaxID=40148 RepID=A0A0D9ZGJ5_9ORYZ
MEGGMGMVKLQSVAGWQIASVMRGVGDVVKHHERGGEVTTARVGGEQSICDYRGGAMEQPPAEHGGRRACLAGVAREWTVTEVGGGCVRGGGTGSINYYIKGFAICDPGIGHAPSAYPRFRLEGSRCGYKNRITSHPHRRSHHCSTSRQPLFPTSGSRPAVTAGLNRLRGSPSNPKLNLTSNLLNPRCSHRQNSGEKGPNRFGETEYDVEAECTNKMAIDAAPVDNSAANLEAFKAYPKKNVIWARLFEGPTLGDNFAPLETKEATFEQTKIVASTLTKAKPTGNKKGGLAAKRKPRQLEIIQLSQPEIEMPACRWITSRDVSCGVDVEDERM